MAENDTALQDAEKKSPDWIELFNASDTAIVRLVARPLFYKQGWRMPAKRCTARSRRTCRPTR